ncbi:MAG: hypothetical protein WCB04_04975, partial [Mycobacteriales bacterium]
RGRSHWRGTMRRPHMSAGAWIFTGLVSAAIIAPTAVYAAAASTVAIGNTGNSVTATVTPNHQLLTTTTAPKDVVEARGSSGTGCGTLYVPPAGKAIVVTSVTYDLYGHTAGTETFSFLYDVGCNTPYDIADTTEAAKTETHTFPIGLPMPSVAVSANGGAAIAFFTGYLIPVSQLPAAGPAMKLPARSPHPGTP